MVIAAATPLNLLAGLQKHLLQIVSKPILCFRSCVQYGRRYSDVQKLDVCAKIQQCLL